MIEALRPARFGIVLAMLGLLYGFGLGIVFGAAEDGIKGTLASSAAAVLDSAYGGDPVAADRIVAKSWTYFKRAHLHAGGMGSVAIGLILLLAWVGTGERIRLLASTGLGFGALGYPLFWMFAGLRAPALGSTGLAKASLGWLAWPTSSLFTLAVLVTFGAFVAKIFGGSPAADRPD